MRFFVFGVVSEFQPQTSFGREGDAVLYKVSYFLPRDVVSSFDTAYKLLCCNLDLFQPCTKVDLTKVKM